MRVASHVAGNYETVQSARINLKVLAEHFVEQLERLLGLTQLSEERN